MTQYEYKVVPAPTRGIRQKGARTGADKLAAAVAEVMNALGREGWEYVRADLLPSEEKAGLTRRTTVYHNLLVFRRALADGPARPVPAPAPAVAAPSLLSLPRLRLGGVTRPETPPEGGNAPAPDPSAPEGRTAEGKAAE